MGPYLPLFSLVVEHGYFGGAPCPSLRFTPLEASRQWLAARGCVVRPVPGGLAVYCDGGVLDGLAAALADEPLALTWRLHADDPYFANYTEGLPRAHDGMLAFDSAGAVDDDVEPGLRRLHAGATVGAGDQASPEAVAALLDAVDRRVPPRAMVTLRLAPGDAGTTRAPSAPPVRRFVIRFGARSPVWKYCLLGDWDLAQVRVVDTGAQADFGPGVPEPVADGRVALAIRSRGGIALQQRSSRRFQLRGIDGGTDRVLVKRLPVAGARQLERETIDGVPTWVSEIFVHR